ncbi:MAG: carboxylating nicotinate-nucleotide diphosphorylase [bacterium]
MGLDSQKVAEIVRTALAEDVGSGDVTTQCTVPQDQRAWGEMVAKEEGIVAGLEVAREVYRQVDDRIDFVPHVEDGYQSHAGDVLAGVSGPARGILTAERTALNFLQRLSGIATFTRQFVQKVAGTGVQILDTRKTAPGLRIVEKYAVRVGGGRNHRAGLYDMVLIKDNHLKIVGGIKEAVAKCRQGWSNARVEVEVRSVAEVKEAVEAGVDRIMLDNMGLDEMREAIAYIREKGRADQGLEIEASGGIGPENVRAVAETGVDFISVGALTHSARALDITFNLTV